MDNPNNENCSAIRLMSRVVQAPIRVSDEKKDNGKKVVSEDDKKQEVEKSENESDDEVKGLTHDQFIDKNS